MINEYSLSIYFKCIENGQRKDDVQYSQTYWKILTIEGL